MPQRGTGIQPRVARSATLGTDEQNILRPEGAEESLDASNLPGAPSVRALEIVQNKAPVKPSLDRAAVADSLGEFTVHVSSIRQRFLEADRKSVV